MIKISSEAKEELINKVSFFDEKKHVRIYISGIGWGGPNFDIVLDDTTDSDHTEEHDEFIVVIEKDLMDHFRGFDVDFLDSWMGKRFVVQPSVGGSTCS